MEMIEGQRSAAGIRRSDFDVEAFTLIELLVVITVIIILAGLLFPAFRGVQDQAKKTQAKNDLTQIVTAVNAFYAEYGRYPTGATADVTFGSGGSPTTNDPLFNELRGLSTTTLNPRQIAFFSPPDVKDKANPKSGIGIDPSNAGQFFDPWGKNYIVRLDADYDNQIDNPYLQNAGATPKLHLGVIALSLGRDGRGGIGSADKNSGDAADDVISWQ